MDDDKLLMDMNELPKYLSKQEVYELFEKIKQGNEDARTKVAEHNIRLVLYRVKGRFNTVNYDKKELVSVGNVGLMKAIATFDTSKNLEFVTYATHCIDNEILLFLRQIRKYENVDSLDGIIGRDKDGKELSIGDTLSCDTDIEEEYIDNEINRIVRQAVENLPFRDKKIVKLYFGFYNDKTYTQKEIASILDISRSHVSKLLTDIVERLKAEFQQNNVIELRNDGEKKMAKKIKTIYEYFSSYSKQQVDAMLKKLSEEEIALITLRYGEDLNNPVSGKLNKVQTNKFYGCLIPKMKKLLVDPDKVVGMKKRESVLITPSLDNLIIEGKESKAETQDTNVDAKKEPLKMQNIGDGDTRISKESYIKMLELLKTPDFTQMMELYSTKEAIIVTLKLGYIDGKCFSISEISNFLGIGQQEVLDTTKKVLFDYKERVNQIIDSAIQYVTEEPEISSLEIPKVFHK